MPGADPVQARALEREEMVRTQIERRGVRAGAVLDAMLAVPREWFVAESIASKAYTDAALPIECEQTISQPYMVARMTELLELEPPQRVLEIGTGSGYQTAILALLSGQVYTVEWYLRLMSQAVARLERLGQTNVTFRCGDGSSGWPEHAPYDAILVTAGAPSVPKSLSNQLAPGGRLVIPVGGKGSQTLVRVVRTESGFEREEYLSCRFVKLVGEEGWAE
jgi:protein-L-isoaspartate(D-aspartate) O-methyltransferase